MEMYSPLEPPEGMETHCGFSPIDPFQSFDFKNCYDKTFMLFYATQFVICYRRNRKLIHGVKRNKK